MLVAKQRVGFELLLFRGVLFSFDMAESTHFNQTYEYITNSRLTHRVSTYENIANLTGSKY